MHLGDSESFQGLRYLKGVEFFGTTQKLIGKQSNMTQVVHLKPNQNLIGFKALTLPRENNLMGNLNGSLYSF